MKIHNSDSKAVTIITHFMVCLFHRFGNILEGEIEACREIARGTGVLVDPVYTLSAWDTAARLAENDTNVVMLHTGGTLGMFGLAQRYKSYFSNLKT